MEGPEIKKQPPHQIPTRKSKGRISVKEAIRYTSMGAYYLGSAFLWIIMFMVTIDVVGRYFFNKPLYGSLEICEFLLAGTVLLGLAYTQHLRGQVTVELFFDKFSESTQQILKIFHILIGIGFFSIIAWQSGILAIETAQNNLTSDILKIPAWPFRLFVPIGSVLLVLELLLQLFEGYSEMIRDKREG